MITAPTGTPLVDVARGAVIELERVTKVYRTGSISVAALRGVSLTIDEGEYVAIIGPSGSGKSTLMHILGCLDVPTSGRFHLAGEDVSNMSETALAEVRNKRIGFVFQQFNLLASLTAWQNVELPLVYAGVGRTERKERAMEALGRVGLTGRVNHRPGELSGGQQQRVAVARALVTEPDLILADEPTGNLDSKSAADVMRLMGELYEAGRTLVLITHDADVAVRRGSSRRHPRRPALRARRERPRKPEHPVSWLETIRTGVNGVRSHRLRSALTVLGIFIGIAGVIIAVGLGEGASSQVTSEINSLGSNVLTITPGSSTSSSGIREALGSSSTLTMADVAALQSPVDAPDVKEVAPITSQTEVLTAGSETATTSVQGTTPTWLSVRGRTLAEGRFIDNQDVNDHTAVGVLGATTASELFTRGDPVGQTVDVDGVPVTIVGVLTSTGSSSSSSSGTSDPDDTLIIPISTGAERIFGGTSRNSVSSIALQARSSADLTAAYQEADHLLLQLHGITNSSDADFTITSEQSLIAANTSVDHTLTILLGGIAAISLVVGGIGVMNIMLVSVTERIREIGLRKALGATPRVIRRQFLVEASVLGILGGIVGVVGGILGVIYLPGLIGDPMTTSPTAAVGALAIALAIGVLFGVYPASRAAALAPIDALRNE